MDKKYFDAVLSEMQPLLDGQKFSETDGIYKNEEKAVKVEYNDASKQFILLIADVTDGETGEFAAADSWLFDETQTEQDALAVGVDFADTLREKLGIKKSKTSIAVELPVAEKGDTANISALTQKLLAVFPQLKETYKSAVQENNRFLYLNFYTEHFVPAISNLLNTGTKKQLKKLFDMLSDMYNTANGETADIIVALLTVVAYGNTSNSATVNDYIAENQHLKTAVHQFKTVLSKNKKLQSALLK